ncbi:transcriptional regulator [Blautia sp. An249]|uniref:transcriptional regulator n=1 Tax=Blautia sp. An249 TaxID=1965603 RepID=UPI000B375C4F|nr:transcriptional regulator [Blautia sp. An249]
MPMHQNLTGRTFGKLKVLKRLDEKQDRYYVWLCQCECGNIIKVNTRRLTRGTVTDCGCTEKKTARNGSIAEDLTGRRFGKLVALSRAQNQNGRTCWLCRCDCGREKIVAAHELKAGKTKSCGCARMQRGKGVRNIYGKKFGRLTPMYPTEKRDRKGGVYWHCRCDCGRETDVTEDGLVWGNYRSCGCLKQEIQEQLPERLHHVDGTCIEILEKRKYRKDNTSGFRGVYLTKNGKYKTCIGLKQTRYWLGTYETFEEAVRVRMEAEKLLHGGFLKAYYQWKEQAEKNPRWEKENPFSFQVEKVNGALAIVRDTGKEKEQKGGDGL